MSELYSLISAIARGRETKNPPTGFRKKHPPRSGKPLTDANIHASVWTDEKGFKANDDYKTDAAGVAVVELPKTFTVLRHWASKKPFVTLFANRERGEVASGKVPG